MAVNPWGCNSIGRDNPSRVQNFLGRGSARWTKYEFCHFVILAGTVYFEPANKQDHLTDDTDDAKSNVLSVIDRASGLQRGSDAARLVSRIGSHLREIAETAWSGRNCVGQ
jgi:hypothetical protein